MLREARPCGSRVVSTWLATLMAGITTVAALAQAPRIDVVLRERLARAFAGAGCGGRSGDGGGPAVTPRDLRGRHRAASAEEATGPRRGARRTPKIARGWTSPDLRDYDGGRTVKRGLVSPSKNQASRCCDSTGGAVALRNVRRASARDHGRRRDHRARRRRHTEIWKLMSRKRRVLPNQCRRDARRSTWV